MSSAKVVGYMINVKKKKTTIVFLYTMEDLKIK